MDEGGAFKRLNGNGIWRFTSGVLAAVVVSFLGFWLTIGQGLSSKADMAAAIAVMQRQQDEQNKRIDRLETEVNQLGALAAANAEEIRLLENRHYKQPN